MNAKIGQPLWITPRPKELPERTMIIGIDIYKKLIQKKKSCVGFVASLDPQFSKYYSRISIQDPKDELLKNITSLVKDAILEFYNQNGKKFFPELIIIYRDGVGEGQLANLISTEVAAVL
jgi:aubergine-like protein